MKQIKHVIMQSKSKVGTRNVRVKIERLVGNVLTVKFNGKEMSIGCRTDLQAEKEALENGLNAAGKSATQLGNAFGTLAGTMHMAASPELNKVLTKLMEKQASDAVNRSPLNFADFLKTGTTQAFDAVSRERAMQTEGEKLLAELDKSRKSRKESLVGEILNAEFGTHTVPDQKPLTYENILELRQKLKSSNGIEDEVDYFNQCSRFATIPTRVDRQLLIDDDLPSLAMQRLQRFEPVHKPVVVFDEVHDHKWYTVKHSVMTQSGFEEEFTEICKICGVEKSTK